MKSKILTSSALLVLSLNFISCNKPEEFGKAHSEVGFASGVNDPEISKDILCSDAKDFDACLSLGDICQPAYKDLASTLEKEYEACVFNPEISDDKDYPLVNPPKVSDDKDYPLVNPPKLCDKLPVAEEVSELADIKDCNDLPEKFLVRKENGKSKVLICHSEGNGDSHAIAVACSALKAHIKHHDGKDYLGACKSE